ncbi:hypothetical protein D3C87_2109240 [compost metagenome]
MNEKPRLAVSSWWLDTPRSSRMPSSGSSGQTGRTSAKFPARIVTLVPMAESRARAASIASGSWSIP